MIETDSWPSGQKKKAAGPVPRSKSSSGRAIYQLHMDIHGGIIL